MHGKALWDLGYRVPLVIASPWTRGGWVNSQVCDLTSTFSSWKNLFPKKPVKKLKKLISAIGAVWLSGDLTSAFRPYQGEKINLPAFLKRDPFVEEIYNAKFKDLPSGFKALNASEKEEIKKNRASFFTSSTGTRHSEFVCFAL